VKPPVFEYYRPDTVDEALALLAEHGGDAKVLAGGQSLIPTMNFRLAQPAVLVDLNRVDALAHVTEAVDGGLLLGAMTRQRVLETHPQVTRRYPLLAEAMPHVAHPQIRNRGTLGGSLAHADPAAELPAVTVALDARIKLRSSGGERELAMRDFFTGLFATALEPGELVTAIVLPPPVPRTGWAFLEVARRHGDYALVGVAARVSLDGNGRCTDTRVVLLSVGEGPVASAGAAQALAGQAPTPAAIAAAAAAAQAETDPPGDIHASAAYRKHLVGILTRRALEKAAGQAGSRSGGR
jgi:aerobic carbon-monoxide dehydrogenase medium subunit